MKPNNIFEAVRAFCLKTYDKVKAFFKKSPDDKAPDCEPPFQSTCIFRNKQRFIRYEPRERNRHFDRNRGKK